MLAEFIDRITGLARESRGTQIKSCPELRKVFVHDGQTMHEHDLPPVERDGFLDGIDDIVLAAQDGDMCADPEIFHNASAITLVCDRHDGHETMTMPLRLSNRWTLLNRLAQDQQSMPARQLIRMLRFELSGAGCDGVISAMRRIDFTRTSDGRSSVEHGRESLGRSVEAAVQQADKVPETFDVVLPIYMNAGLRDVSTVAVQCGIHIDVHDETILVRPLADELEAAQVKAQSAIGDLLRVRLEQIPVFHGHPTR